MITPMALANIDKPVNHDEVEESAYVIAEFIDYLRWLADQDMGRQLVAGEIWTLFYESVREGRHWSDICADLGLPVREQW